MSATGCSYDGCEKPAAARKGGLCEGHARQRQRGQPLRPLRHYGDPRRTLVEAAMALADADALGDGYDRAYKRLYQAARRLRNNVPRRSHAASHDAG